MGFWLDIFSNKIIKDNPNYSEHQNKTLTFIKKSIALFSTILIYTFFMNPESFMAWVFFIIEISAFCYLVFEAAKSDFDYRNSL